VPVLDRFPVEGELGDPQVRQVEIERGEVLPCAAAQHGVPLESVGGGFHRDVEVVVFDVVAQIAVPRYVRVAHSGSSQGPIGLPIHRVLLGTPSPRITSDTGPTVA
jgi:hypothetical protein